MVSHLDLLNLNIEEFRPYLQNDEMLGEKDTVELHLGLQILEKRRQEINRTIDVLSITMDALRRSHDELNATIFSYRSLVSPIRNIPDDVLGEIFTYTLPAKRNAFPIHTEMPLLLTSICKRWRNVAYSTPQLWSKLHVVLPDDNAEGYKAEALWRHRYLSTIKHFLWLSGSVPLSLSITYSDRGVHDGLLYPEAKDLLLPLIQQSHRWCHIDIECGPDTIQYINERIVPSSTGTFSLPLLRRLRIRPLEVPDTSATVDFNLLYAFFMPSLRGLSLDLSRSPSSFPFSKLQAAPYWISLTHLAIHHFEYDVQLLLDLLPRCQELQQLLLGTISDWDAKLDNYAPVYLPKLTKLTLQGGSGYDNSLYGCLDTPLLDQLSLYPGYWYCGEDVDVPERYLVQTFIAQCRNLQTLVISPGPDKVLMRRVFEGDPGITTLILDPSNVLFKNAQFTSSAPASYGHRSDGMMEVLVLLTNHGTQSASLPLLSNLKSCSLINAWTTQEDADTILAFCKSRMVRHTTSSTSTGTQPTVASLDHIKMVLIKQEKVVDVRKELLQYAESIGRRVGEDINIDITYPWGDQRQYAPPPLNPRSDLNRNTGCTWDTIDA